MDKEEFDKKTKIIEERFKDTRTIKCPTPKEIRELDDNIYPGRYIFTTEEGEFIDLELQLKDFDEAELTKYIDFAENLYEKHKKHVSIYILCPKNINICVRECKIISEAEFTIKLAYYPEDLCQFILNTLQNKIENNETLDCEDIHMAELLPLMCEKKDKNYYRLESLKIVNNAIY